MRIISDGERHIEDRWIRGVAASILSVITIFRLLCIKGALLMVRFLNLFSPSKLCHPTFDNRQSRNPINLSPFVQLCGQHKHQTIQDRPDLTTDSMAPLSLMSIATLVVGALLPALGSTNPIEKRGDSVFYTVQDFKSHYGYDMIDACYWANTDGDTDYENCLIATDNSTWVAATYNSYRSPAEYIWAPDDTTTANCLINQHYVHDKLCVSVRGSECEAKAGTSKILNARLSVYGGLSSEQSRTLQEATRAFVGSKVNSKGNNEEGFASGVYLMFFEWQPRLKMDKVCPDRAGKLGIVFGGAEQC